MWLAGFPVVSFYVGEKDDLTDQAEKSRRNMTTSWQSSMLAFQRWTLAVWPAWWPTATPSPHATTSIGFWCISQDRPVDLATWKWCRLVLPPWEGRKPAMEIMERIARKAMEMGPPGNWVGLAWARTTWFYTTYPDTVYMYIVTVLSCSWSSDGNQRTFERKEQKVTFCPRRQA